MTDTTTQTEGAQAPATDPGKTWYVYETAHGLNVWKGKTLTTASNAAQPANSVPWQPPSQVSGRISFWDGVGWRLGTDITALGLDDLKVLATSASRQRMSGAIWALSGTYAPEERDTWAQQQAEATAWTADNTAATPLLTALASARSTTVADLAPKILEKAAAYSTAYYAALAQHQKERDSISAATSSADLPAFTLADLHLGILS